MDLQTGKFRSSDAIFLLDNEQNFQNKVPHDREVAIMFASHNTKACSAFVAATIAALLIAFSPNLHAQSPLII